MKRRGFLGLLTGAAAAAVVAPAALAEILEPKRTIFLPPKGGWAPRDFSTANMRYVHREVAMGFKVANGNVLLTRDELSKQLLEGLNKVFHEEYEKAEFFDLYDPVKWFVPPGDHAPLATFMHKRDLYQP